MSKISVLSGIFLQIAAAHAETPATPQSTNVSDFSAKFIPAPAQEDSSDLYATNDERITLACPQIHDVSVERHYTQEASFANATLINFAGRIKHHKVTPKNWLKTNLSMYTMEEAPSGEEYYIQIHSSGGVVEIGKNYLQNIKASSATVITANKARADSMASLLLFSGDVRIATIDAQIVVHEAHKKLASTNQVIWDSEMSEADGEDLEDTNEWFRDEYVRASRTDINEECVETLIGERDIRIASMTALKLGWIDRVYLNDHVWYERSDTLPDPIHKTVVIDRKLQPTRPLPRPF